MGLLVSVYKNLVRDCTAGGISSHATELLLVNVDGPTANNHAAYPKALLVKGNGTGLVKIVPAYCTEIGEWRPAACWAMMGGNYAATSDSRFHDAVRKIIGSASYGAVPIHDRFE